MKRRLREWLEPWLVRTETVPVASCVHFCGFRYGRQEFNPYENYATALASGADVRVARERFVEFLRHYRPRNFGEALGLELERSHELWDFPWAPSRPAGAGWREAPDDVPDILTHFSAQGILRTRIDEEFSWLEQSLASIREHGYQPQRYDGDIEAWKLVATGGEARYLILDGNHRLSALAALGRHQVAVRFRWRMTVSEDRLPRWTRVAAGGYSAADARRVFRGYFTGNPRPRTTETPAPIIEVGTGTEAQR